MVFLSFLIAAVDPDVFRSPALSLSICLSVSLSMLSARYVRCVVFRVFREPTPLKPESFPQQTICNSNVPLRVTRPVWWCWWWRELFWGRKTSPQTESHLNNTPRCLNNRGKKTLFGADKAKLFVFLFSLSLALSLSLVLSSFAN